MRIDDLEFTTKEGTIIISDGQDQYANVFYPAITPVCKDAENCFALTDGGGERLFIDRSFTYHEDVQVKMLLKGSRTKALRMVNFPANILEKQKGKRKSGIIIKHPLFNGLICRAVTTNTENREIWAVYRPFLVSNCRTRIIAFDPDPPSDGKAFYDKYLRITYNFPQTEEDPIIVYKLLIGEASL